MRKMKVELLKLATLKPNKHNARLHTEAQITQLVGSLDEFGWVKPLIVDEKLSILAGHGMYLAAKQRGDDSAPVIRIEGLTAAQKRAYLIADNKLAMNSEWDNTALSNELRRLSAEDFNLLVVGFSQSELEKLMAEENVTSPDDFAEADENLPTQHVCPKCGYKWSGKSGE